jgi:hypothetical protein
VTELVTDPEDRWSDPWLRTCALHAAPVVLGAAAPDVVRRWVDDPDPVVAETARAALGGATAGTRNDEPGDEPGDKPGDEL